MGEALNVFGFAAGEARGAEEGEVGCGDLGGGGEAGAVGKQGDELVLDGGGGGAGDLGVGSVIICADWSLI